jgi:hypothetical protein
MHKFFIVALALGAGFVWWSSGMLPATVASHFVGGGVADAFLPRRRYVDFMLGLVIALPSLVFVAGRLASRLPVRFINLPHRQYWLAPERQAATLASLQSFATWAAYATLALLCVAHGFVVRAQLAQPPHLEQAPLVACLALYLIALFVGMLTVLGRFFRAP